MISELDEQEIITLIKEALHYGYTTPTDVQLVCYHNGDMRVLKAIVTSEVHTYKDPTKEKEEEEV